MALVSRIRNRRVRQVSRGAEACETRSLLCAAAISLAGLEVQDMATDAAPDETAEKLAVHEDAIVSDDMSVELTALPEGMCFTCELTLPVEVAVEAGEFTVDDSSVLETNDERADWDPAWAYRTLMVSSGEEGAEGERFDPAVCFAASEGFEIGDAWGSNIFTEVDDSIIVDGGDQSWIYRTFLPPGSEKEMEEGTFDPAVCDVAPDGMSSAGGEGVDNDGDGLPDAFAMYPYDPIALEFTGHDGLDCGVALDGFVSADGEAVKSSGDEVSDEFVMYAYNSVEVEFTGHDGLDCGVAPDSLGLEGPEMVDSDGDGVFDLEVVMEQAWDPSWAYRGGIEFGETVVDAEVTEEIVEISEIVEGDVGDKNDAEVVVFVEFHTQEKTLETDPISGPIEAIAVEVEDLHYADGPMLRSGIEAVEEDTKSETEDVPVDVTPTDSGNTVELDYDVVAVDVVSETGEVPVDVILYSMNVVGSEEVQRTVQSVERDEPVSLALAAGPASLFESSLDPSSVATLISSEEVAPLEVAVPKVNSSSSTRTKSTSLLTSPPTTGRDEFEGLSPLLNGSDDAEPSIPSDSDSDELTIDEEAISDVDRRSSGKARATVANAANNYPDQEVAKRSSRAFNIDKFMTEFAQDSFMG